MAMLVGMQLDVFTALKDGPFTGAEIAAAIGAKPTKLMPLLHALVAPTSLPFRMIVSTIHRRLTPSWCEDDRHT